MKKILLILLGIQLFSISYCQSRKKYMVLFFNSIYKIGQYINGSGDYAWIVPMDSCGQVLDDKDIYPLFIDSFQILSLEDSILCSQAFGEFPIEYSPKDSIAWLLYKNRKKMQVKEIKYFYPNAKEKLSIYCVPIIANCNYRQIGFYKKTIVTIENCPIILSDFWNDENIKRYRTLLNYDFSNFDYIVSLSKKE